MDRDEALALFESLTSAPPHVAEHVLDAHGWDVNSAVEWYLESGGVGHGEVGAVPPFGGAGSGPGAGGDDDWGAGGGWEDVQADVGAAAAPAYGGAAAAAAPAPALPPDYIEEPDDVIVDEPPEAEAVAAPSGRGGQGRTASRPMPASARPRSSPIEILDDDDDEDIQVLASSLGRRRPSRTDELMEVERGMHRVGSVEEELEGAGSQGRRVRRNRRRVAGEVDRDLELLGQRFGVMDEYQPAPAAAHRQQQQQRPGPGRGGSGGGSGDEDLPLLPDDVDMEEQRMLMAALQGGGYEGQIPDFANDPRYQQRVLSPGAQARQNLREEQDAAYYESLRADQEKAEEAERQRREAEEAAAAAAMAAEAEARHKAEAAERLAQELRWKAASLPPEPPADDPEAVSLAVRLPTGGRYSRRFRRSDSLQAVFDFVDVQSGTESGALNGSAAAGGEGGAATAILPGAYSLATSYPRRVLQDGPAAAGMSLADAGITSKQEALFLELK